MNVTTAPTAWHRAPVALLRVRTDGVLLDANEIVLGWLGRPREEVVGRVRLADLLAVGGRIYWETHLAPLLHLQGRVEEVAVEVRTSEGRLPVLLTAVLADEGGERVIEVALMGAGGRSRFERELLDARRDAERAAEQVRALQRTTAAFVEALGTDGVARALLGPALEGLPAVEARLWLSDGLRLVPYGRVRRERPDVVDGLQDAPGRTGADGRVSVPLPGRRRLEGVLEVVPLSGSDAVPLDADMLTAIAQQAGVALERARLHDETAAVAHELQHALLAAPAADDRRVDVSTFYRPGVRTLEVGGDWFDAFHVEDDVLAVTLGDVVGRGLSAATAMGALRSALRAVAAPGVGPADVLRRLDRFVAVTGTGVGTTVVYAELDLRSGVLRHASAGHPPALRVRADGGGDLLWDGRSLPLGVASDRVPRTEAVTSMAVGDRLVLYSDGLVERRDERLEDSLAALARAARVLQPGPGGAAELVERTAPDTAGERDDVCALVLTRTAG